MKTVFISGGPHKNGTTVHLAQILLDRRVYESIHLVDYKIYSYGQKFDDDEFHKVLEAMKQADTIVIGSPVYWHNLSGAVRNLLDRLYGAIHRQDMKGKRLFFLFQAAAPDKCRSEGGE